MSKIRLASDIHSEFFDLVDIEKVALDALPVMEGDAEMTLVLAGDIGSMHKPANLMAFIDEVAPRFSSVYYTPGNHEFYRGDLKTTVDVIESLVREHKNVKFSAMRSYDRVHVGTLWTDFDGGNPLSMELAGMYMNDYRLINNGNRIARPMDTLQIHESTVEHLREFVRRGDIVVTHHSPSFKSVPDEFKGDKLNGAYASGLEEMVLDLEPVLWCHGNHHTACDYMIGETRVVCNPRGYGNQHKSNGYNPELVIDTRINAV